MLAAPDEAGIIDTEYVLRFFQNVVDQVQVGPRQTQVGLTPRMCSGDDRGIKQPGKYT